MPGLVADTHALVWYVVEPARLSEAASRRMQDAVRCGDPIGVPTICLVELVYLVEKGRLPMAVRDRVWRRMDDTDSDLELVPLGRGVVEALARVRREHVPDMPDRIIAATAVHLGVPLVSRDGRIRDAGIEVVW